MIVLDFERASFKLRGPFAALKFCHTRAQERRHPLRYPLMRCAGKTGRQFVS